jgi:hypothetical protein
MQKEVVGSKTGALLRFGLPATAPKEIVGKSGQNLKNMG